MRLIDAETRASNVQLDLKTTRCSLKSRPRWTQFWEERELSAGKIDNIVRTTGRNISPSFTGYGVRAIHVYIESSTNEQFFTTTGSIAPIVQKSSPRTEHQFKERNLLATNVDFDLIRQWRSFCQDAHGEKCSKPLWLHMEEPTTLRLIDVEARAIVNAPPKSHYAALSYVWGSSDGRFMLDESNLPRTINDQVLLPQLPNTIEDALRVTAELQIRYLWVDALCIAQRPDANSDQLHQLGQMDRIYKSAEIVIIAAACESANDDIPGVNHRQADQLIRNFRGVELAISQPTYEHGLYESIYDERAWTYQEQMFSRRALVFRREQAYWLCQCDLWCESVVLEPAPSGTDGFVTRMLPDTSKPPTRCMKLETYDINDELIMHDKQTLTAYVRVVTEYTRRRLGYPEDGLNAIAGILKFFKSIDKANWTVLHSGLPESFFDGALLWVPLTKISRPTEWRFKRKLPSWSWTGWFGNQGHGIVYDINTMGSFDPGCIDVIPAIKWHTVTREGDSIAMGTYLRSRAHWDRIENRMVAGIDPCRHSEQPTRLSKDIRRPTRDGEYLHLLTTTAIVCLGRKISSGYEPYWESPEVSPYQLTDKNGRFIGTIILSGEEASRAREEPIKCIFLSYAKNFDFVLCREAKKADSGESLHDLASWENYEVVNVMWISKAEDGVVERIAIAKILEKMWLELTPKTEWIVLG